MTFDASDPRLTAYALGELDGSERAEIEALLAENAPARQFVAEIRDTAQLLTDQFRSETSPGLAAEHHQAIEVGLRPKPTPRSLPRWIPLAAAACLLGGVTIAAWLASRSTEARVGLAMKTPAAAGGLRRACARSRGQLSRHSPASSGAPVGGKDLSLTDTAASAPVTEPMAQEFSLDKLSDSGSSDPRVSGSKQRRSRQIGKRLRPTPTGSQTRPQAVDQPDRALRRRSRYQDRPAPPRKTRGRPGLLPTCLGRRNSKRRCLANRGARPLPARPASPAATPPAGAAFDRGRSRRAVVAARRKPPLQQSRPRVSEGQDELEAQNTHRSYGAVPHGTDHAELQAQNRDRAMAKRLVVWAAWVVAWVACWNRVAGHLQASRTGQAA